MKITCNRDRLLAAFQTAATVAAARTSKPILQNVKMEATDTRVTLTATDLEVGIRVELEDQEVQVPGNALLSVSQFGSILRESNDERIHIESDGQGIRIRGDRSRFRLPSQNPAEFPDFPEPRDSNYYTLTGRLLRELIRRTLFATDTDSSRYALGGVLLEFEDEKITAVGTDGRRLAKMEGPITKVGNPTSGDSMTIVPARSMQLIERAVSDPEQEVKILGRGNDFVVRTASTTIVTRLVEGRFPRWRDVLPRRSNAVTIELVVGPLLSAVRQAAIVTSADSRGIDLIFGGGQLVISGLTADVGESRIELPISYEGSPIELCLDHRYITDFLRVLDADRSLTMNIVDSDSAALCETDDGYGYVVMPLARERVNRAAASTADAAVS